MTLIFVILRPNIRCSNYSKGNYSGEFFPKNGYLKHSLMKAGQSLWARLSDFSFDGVKDNGCYLKLKHI